LLQPSQWPTYVLFLGFCGILIAIFLWGLRKGISRLQELPDFTDLETAAIRGQMLALLGLPLFILFLVLSPLGWDLAKPSTFFVALIIGLAPLAYISVSSIRNRVSILRGRGPLPDKGARAVWDGVANLALILLALVGYALYFASSK